MSTFLNTNNQELELIRAIFDHGANESDWIPGTQLWQAVQKVKAERDKIPPYYRDSSYRALLEKCHEICSKIYLHRNIVLDEVEIIKCLKEIDILLADKGNYN